MRRKRAAGRAPAGFPRGSYLYGYAAAARSASPFVVLVEGAPDALRVMEAGYPAVASLGADLTEVQADKLAALNKQVLVAFDNDEAGREGAERAVTRLRGKKVWPRTWSPLQEFKDLGDTPWHEVVAWVEDWRQDQEELDAILSGRD
jgi:Toprim-like